MTGISMEFEFDDREAQAMLRGLIGRMENRRTFFERVGDRLLNSISLNFQNERGPDGAPWTPLRAATIRERTRKDQLPISILRSNTRIGSSLAGSINRQITNDELKIGTPVPYGAIHQLGGTIDKPARQAKIYRMKDEQGRVGRRFVSNDKANHVTDVTIPAHPIRIPARPFLGISAEDQAAIIGDAENWLTL